MDVEALSGHTKLVQCVEIYFYVAYYLNQLISLFRGMVEVTYLVGPGYALVSLDRLLTLAYHSSFYPHFEYRKH